VSNRLQGFSAAEVVQHRRTNLVQQTLEPAADRDLGRILAFPEP
jgi:hypothetical protein